MSTLKVTNIAGLTGSSTNVMDGLAKAWIDAPGGYASINDSFNISSLDDNGTGGFGLNYTSSFSNVYYPISTGVEEENTSPSTVVQVDATQPSVLKTTGATDFEVYIVNSGVNRSLRDLRAWIVLNGDLA